MEYFSNKKENHNVPIARYFYLNPKYRRLDFELMIDTRSKSNPELLSKCNLCIFGSIAVLSKRNSLKTFFI